MVEYPQTWRDYSGWPGFVQRDLWCWRALFRVAGDLRQVPMPVWLSLEAAEAANFPICRILRSRDFERVAGMMDYHPEGMSAATWLMIAAGRGYEDVVALRAAVFEERDNVGVRYEAELLIG